MVEKNWLRLVTAALLLALGAASGCVDQEKVREEDLADLIAWLPGHYDNAAQVAEEAQKSGHPAHEAIALLIVKVHAQRLGHHVFYVQESAANDPRRIMSSRMFSFDTDEKNGIVGLIYEFNEPARWRDALQHPELFTGLEQEDVSAAGCEFLWKRTAGEVVASFDPKRCHRTEHQVGQNAAELTSDSLSIANYNFKRTATH
jgi:CpeT/CpcT family (DUF1001)